MAPIISSSYYDRTFCGCWYLIAGRYQPEKKHLPQVELSSSTQILATTSRTTLTQTFINPSKSDKLDEVQYTFPLYDGVSVVGFQCTVASRTIVGIVKEKQQARTDYKKAIDRGESAGLLEQLPESSDVFTTKIGNVPVNEKIIVEIVYLGELKHDAETDGSRFTIPTFIAPRYGSISAVSSGAFLNQATDKGGIRILVDVVQEEGSVIRGLQSPSHPIAVTMGRTSYMHEDTFNNNYASATLTLGSTELDKDFIIVILAKGQDTPRALMETHSSIPDQRAIMATLVPKFSLPIIHPEIVFVVDRSGSMGGKIETLVSSMRIFLKSLPVGVKFNICSFGSSFDFLFPKSRTYDQTSMQEALTHLTTFSSNYGGTAMLQPVKATVENRYKDMYLEVMLITDGQVFNQQELFDFINKAAKDGKVRFFSLGIGVGASSSLVEGIARAGDGFAQFVGDNEKMDKRIVRMLKGALTPHIKNYSLEVKYEKEQEAMDDDFEIIESVNESHTVVVTDLKKPSPKQKVISLFNKSAKEEPTNLPGGRYDHLPTITTPNILQTPHKIPQLYQFNRTTVYLLLNQEACRKTPKSIVLRATSEHGPLELEIPIQNVGHGESIHQLAAKKEVHELEQGRGWITDAKGDSGKLLSKQFQGRWDEIVEREAVRLGVQFQVGGKWCSFVAVEKHTGNSTGDDDDKVEWEIQEGSVEKSGSKNEYKKKTRMSLGGGGAMFGLSSGESLFGNLNALQTSSGTVPVTVTDGIAGSRQPQSSASQLSMYPQAQQTTGGFGSPISEGRSDRFVDQLCIVGTRRRTSTSAGFGLATPPAGGLFGATTSATPSNISGASAKAETECGSPLPGYSAVAKRSQNLFGNQALAMRDVSRPANTIAKRGDPSLKNTNVFASQASSNTLFHNSTANRYSPATQADASAPLGPQAHYSMTQSSASSMMMQAKSVAGHNPPGYRESSAMPELQASACFAPVSDNANQSAAYQQSLMTLQQQLLTGKRKVSGEGQPRSRSAATEMKGSNDNDMDFGLHDARSVAAPAAARSMVFRGGSQAGARFSTPSCTPGTTLAAHEFEGYAPGSDEEKMYELIGLQTFDGSWDLTNALLAILGVSKDKLNAAFGHEFSAKLNGKNGEYVKATLAAIAFLEAKLKHEKDVWEMVVDKARNWAEGLVGTGFEDEVGAVKRLLSA